MSKDLFFEMQQQSIADSIEQIENGDIESFETYALLDQIEKFSKQAKDQLKEIVLEQAKNELEGNSKEFSKNGIKFTIRNGATRYSFKHIKKWQEKNAELKTVEEQSKQAFLAMQKNMAVATEDGEEIELPEVTYSSDSVSVTIPKHERSTI